jgi:predicted nucleotidyltransferase component of viral defense system
MSDTAEPTPVHEDPDLFREALNYTAAQTGFAAGLIEKDYFCSAMLAGIAGAGEVVFKGGTCLTKVHVGFYRLSEDLDFALSLPAGSSRAVRGRSMGPVKAVVAEAIAGNSCFRMPRSLRGANDCSQYLGTVAYTSRLTNQEETIKLEFSLREPLLVSSVTGEARTMLLNPISGTPMLPAIAVRCIAPVEAIAEKYRAALTRREVAIRDFYDINHAHSKITIDTEDPVFIELLRKKLAVPGNDLVSVRQGRLDHLRGQLESRLKPVLRPTDFDTFDLAGAIGRVLRVAERLGGQASS